MTDSRVSTEYAQALIIGSPDSIVTTESLQALITGTPVSNVSSQYLHALVPTRSPRSANYIQWGIAI
jgi:hypothetical protein